MKVLHLVDNYLPPTETFIKRYIQKTDDIGETVVAAFNIVNIPADISGSINVYKIKDRLHSKKNIKGILSLLQERVWGKKEWHSSLKKIIKEFAPDIIHCHFGMMGIIMDESTKWSDLKVPFVTSFYGYDASSVPKNNKPYRKQLFGLWQSGAGFMAEGPAMADKLIALGCQKEKCYINPLLIPLDDYPVKEDYRQVNDPVRFLFVGRFIEKKGFHIFLQALGTIKKELKDFTITVVGAGPMKDRYDEIIRQNGLSDKITWLGLKDHKEILEMLPNFDFLVHPSLEAADGDSEGGAPTIIIEAQAVGLPVITTNHADIPYIMGYHDFLAKENNVDSLVKIIRKMLTSDNMPHYAVIGRQKVLQLHDLRANTSYEANLRKLAARK